MDQFMHRGLARADHDVVRERAAPFDQIQARARVFAAARLSERWERQRARSHLNLALAHGDLPPTTTAQLGQRTATGSAAAAGGDERAAHARGSHADNNAARASRHASGYSLADAVDT